MRMERTRLLAERADERWRQKESLVDDPRMEQNAPSLGTGGDTGRMVRGQKVATEAGQGENVTGRTTVGGREWNPWKQHAGVPGEDGQPTSWSPGRVGRR